MLPQLVSFDKFSRTTKPRGQQEVESENEFSVSIFLARRVASRNSAHRTIPVISKIQSPVVVGLRQLLPLWFLLLQLVSQSYFVAIVHSDRHSFALIIAHRTAIFN